MILASTIQAVPFGEDNAISGHCVWNRIRSYAEAAVLHNLESLVRMKRIERSEYVNADGKAVSLYWRQV